MKSIGTLVLEQASKKIADFEAFPTALGGLRQTFDRLTTPEGKFEHRAPPDSLLVVVAYPANTILADFPLSRVPSLVGQYSADEGLNFLAMAARQGEHKAMAEIYLGMMAPSFVPPTSDNPVLPKVAVVGVFEGDHGAGFEAWLPPCAMPRWLN